MAETTTTDAAPNRSNALIKLVIALLLSFAIMQIFKEPPYNNIKNDQLQVMLQNNVPIYDVRRPEEWYQTGIIEGSKMLTFVDADGRIQANFLSRFTADVGKNDPVILICRTGSRTSTLAHLLVEELGYTNIFNVDDGITRWLGENRPVQSIIKPTLETQYIKGLI